MKREDFRSGFEYNIACYLESKGVEYKYEEYLLTYRVADSSRQRRCAQCDSSDVYVTSTYKPDFWLPDLGIFIETKGRFTKQDREKMIAVKEQHPDEDIRILFMDNRVIDKRNMQRHLDWCQIHEYTGAVKEVPDEWLKRKYPKA